ncbi:ATP-dependent nuclease [Algiphilus aromaticivorans]|uniref:ATP-dependent nuclease n=1 Tax=Algiphilus aromaticivorans TaxID=382454 RepID=UPI0009FD3588|nr:AAA family ATPase [Algiphilus aromaticivorans]
MKITKIRIKKFRSVEGATIRASEVSAIVGENNSGKSAVLRALNSFFHFHEEEDAFRLGQHQYAPRTHARIEIEFSGVEGLADLDDYSDGDYLTIRLTYNHSSNTRSLHALQEGRYNPCDLSVLDVIKCHLDFVLIPSVRDAEKLRWQEAAVLKAVVVAYLERHFKSRDSVTPRFKEATASIERNALAKVAKELRGLVGISAGLGFEIGFSDGLTYKDFLDGIRFNVVEGAAKFDVSDCGTGVQSLVIIALYRLLASLRDCSLMVGVEEPEINLHPQAQRQLFSALKRATGTKMQLLFTTHSPVLVDQVSHEDLILVRKVEEAKRGFKTVVNQISDSFFEDHGLQEERYYNFHSQRNSDFLFSRFVVMCEGSIDAAIVRQLLEQNSVDLELQGVTVLNMNSVDNLRYPLHLLDSLAIPRLLIVDKDCFVPYRKDSLDASRSARGFPYYGFDYKDHRLVQDLVPRSQDRDRLLGLLRTNHSRAMDLLEPYKIICMRYSLEMDLIESDTARRMLFERFGVPEAKRVPEELLVKRKKQIKKLENISYVVRALPHKNLPNSYKRVKRVIGRMVNEYCR